MERENSSNGNQEESNQEGRKEETQSLHVKVM
jgi:hypothetical protein